MKMRSIVVLCIALASCLHADDGFYSHIQETYTNLQSCLQSIVADKFCDICTVNYVALSMVWNAKRQANINCPNKESSFQTWQTNITATRDKALHDGWIGRGIALGLLLSDVSDPAVLLTAQHAAAIAVALQNIKLPQYAPSYCSQAYDLNTMIQTGKVFYPSSEPLTQITTTLSTGQQSLADLLQATTSADIVQKENFASHVRQLTDEEFKQAFEYWTGQISPAGGKAAMAGQLGISIQGLQGISARLANKLNDARKG